MSNFTCTFLTLLGFVSIIFVTFIVIPSLLMCLFFPAAMYAQEDAVMRQDTGTVIRTQSAEGDEDITILYRKEASGGITIHSNGWGLTFKSGKHVTGFRKRILDFEFITMKHPK